MPLLVVRMDDDCAVQVEFEVMPERLPTGLELGNPVDVEVFQANGDILHDPQLWLILRSPITSELLFTIHQNPWQLLEAVVARDVLGFDVAIAEPTCEVVDRNTSALHHRYGLRVQTGQTTTVLEDVLEVSHLTLDSGRQLVVHKEWAQHSYFHLATSFSSHGRVGTYAKFAAWPEP